MTTALSFHRTATAPVSQTYRQTHHNTGSRIQTCKYFNKHSKTF